MAKTLISRVINAFEGESPYTNIILYMSCLGASQMSLNSILRVMADAEHSLAGITKTVREALDLMRRWGYGHSESLQHIVKNSGNRLVSELFKRLDYAVKAGVSVKDFAKIEFQKYLALSQVEFEKNLEKLKRIVEAYTTLLSTTSLLAVSFLLISIIFGTSDPSEILEISAAVILSTLSSSSLLFLTTNLRRRLFHREATRPESLYILERLTIPLLILSFFTLAFKFVYPNPLENRGFSILFYSALGGGPVLIHGFLGRRWHKKVGNIEESLSILIRSLGDYIAVSGSLRSASKLMLLNDFGPLNNLLARMEVRVRAGINHALSLKMLGVETLSNLGHRILRMMGEMLEAGSKPSETGGILSDYVAYTLAMDKRRRQVTSSLKWMSVPLHATLAAILALMGTLMEIISDIASLLAVRIVLINPLDVSLATDYFYIILVGISFITSVNILLADGDSVFTFTFYFGLLLLVGGVTFLAMSTVSHNILSSFSRLTESISGLAGGG
ncbi:hypothetical protein HRbin01_00597 [archaeon HR01]|nr:hypothetical protein HRbin01_00597 [archaeon HR01]